MADIFFDNAIDTAIMETVKAGGAESFECIYYSVKEYHIPQCTEEEVQAALDRLISQRKLKFMKGYYTTLDMDRRSFMRFFYEG